MLIVQRVIYVNRVFVKFSLFPFVKIKDKIELKSRDIEVVFCCCVAFTVKQYRGMNVVMVEFVISFNSLAFYVVLFLFKISLYKVQTVSQVIIRCKFPNKVLARPNLNLTQ